MSKKKDGLFNKAKQVVTGKVPEEVVEVEAPKPMVSEPVVPEPVELKPRPLVKN